MMDLEEFAQRGINAQKAVDEVIEDHNKRIVYGTNCVWWDSIDKVATIDDEPGGLPCCPHCKGVLLEIEPGEWWRGVDQQEEKTPGYRALIEWQRGKCFPGMEEAKEAHEKAVPHA